MGLTKDKRLARLSSENLFFKRKKNITHRIHLVLEELKKDFYVKLEILRHHPVFPWFEDYIDEVEEIMGKDPWAHGITQNAPALNQFLHFSYS